MSLSVYRDGLRKFIIIFTRQKNKFEINTHKNKSYRYFQYLCICIAKKEACDIDLTTLSPIPLLF